MGFRLTILVLLVIFNFLPLLAVYRAVNAWVRPERRRKAVLIAGGLLALVLNIPVSVFWIRSLQAHFYEIPASVLRALFYPSVAWLTTAVAVTLILAPAYLIWAAGRVTRHFATKFGNSVPPPPAPSGAPAISRRGFLTGGAGLLVPSTFCFTIYEVEKSLGDVDISPEVTVPIPGLPSALNGMRIVQLSDLHVGPYIRRKEVEHWVSLANDLHPDLVVITGDVIDRSLISLPDAVQGLRGLRADLGVMASMGNHDLSSDRGGARGEFAGGENIANAMREVGIRTLRNEAAYIGSGNDRLAFLGLDWIARPDLRGFYSYHSELTRERLTRITAQVDEGGPKILLAHHPHSFIEAPNFDISLTLSGHTHGGGQVVFFTWDGAPVGLSSAQFRYVSGVYRERGCTLYVNRGLGYFGVPIRINCPPEISRFKLVRV